MLSNEVNIVNGQVRQKTLDGTDYNGDRTFQTYEAWKRACKQINPNVQFDGDKDICQAGNVGEWDGAKGIIYNTKDTKDGGRELLGSYGKYDFYVDENAHKIFAWDREKRQNVLSTSADVEASNYMWIVENLKKDLTGE